jgi:hypothetical protein
MKDAENWRKHRQLSVSIPNWKAEIAGWENRENVPFNQRPLFSPYMTAEAVANCEVELEELAQNLIQPVRLCYTFEEEESSENC